MGLTSFQNDTKMDDNSLLENQCREDLYSEQIHAHVICFTPQMLKQLPVFIRMKIVIFSQQTIDIPDIST